MTEGQAFYKNMTEGQAFYEKKLAWVSCRDRRGHDMTEGQAFYKKKLAWVSCPYRRGHEKSALAGGVAGFGEQTGVLPLHQPCGGPAICFGLGGKRKVPDLDAHEWGQSPQGNIFIC